MCLTPLRSIISWKISPPVLPMNLFTSQYLFASGRGRAIRSYDSSISWPRGLTRGWTCCRLAPWKAGLGTSRGFLQGCDVALVTGCSQSARSTPSTSIESTIPSCTQQTILRRIAEPRSVVPCRCRACRHVAAQKQRAGGGGLIAADIAGGSLGEKLTLRQKSWPDFSSA